MTQRRFSTAIVAVLLIVVPICIAGCPINNGPDGPEVPEWLADLIAQKQNSPVENPPASIVQYEYKGAVVYYVPPRCCDVFSDLYDIEGNVICHPSGGLTGDGDGLCPDFFKQRINEHVIWKDVRTYP